MHWRSRRGAFCRMKRSLTLTSVLAVFLMLFLCGVSGAGAGSDLPGFLEGNYGLIGKKPGSDDTYSGSARIRINGDKLEVLRCVGSSRFEAEGSIIPVTSDRISHVKVRWSDGKDQYEALYAIHGDADNYARLSGPYVRMDDQTSFGWELLYVDPNGGPVCR